MVRRLVQVVVAMGVVLALAGLAQAEPSVHARLVEDINPGPARSLPDGFIPVDDRSVLFSAFEPTNGRELWRSDSPYVASATNLVKDIRPGPAGSFPSFPAKSGRAAFFGANDGVTGSELWKSDGTAEGTVLVKDIHPTGSSSPSALTDVGGTLFFGAGDPVHGRELWKSDGTAEGTVMVKDIAAGTDSSFLQELTNVNGMLFFSAAADGFTELWKSDGTAEGTVMVKDINPGNAHSDPTFLTEVAGTLFFLATDGVNGAELWKSDGSAEGTVMVKDINPGPGWSLPTGLTDVRGTLFFVAFDSAHGRELWKSDGTAEGTMMVKDITAGTDSSFPTNDFFVGDVSLAAVGRTLFFAAFEPDHGRELWKSKGTVESTLLVKDINPGPGDSIPRRPANPGGVISARMTAVEDTLIFRAFDPDHGLEPWLSDGSAEGTVLIDDINPGPSHSVPFGFEGRFTNVDGTVLLNAADSCTNPATLNCDFEPWKTAPRVR